MPGDRPYDSKLVDALLLSIRCLLAAVFIVAAVGKLLDLEGSRRALVEFGVPARAARLGGSCCRSPSLRLRSRCCSCRRHAGARSAPVAAARVQRRRCPRDVARGSPGLSLLWPDPFEPAGRPALIRNAVLAAAAAVIVVAGPGPSLVGALGSLHGARIALVATSVVAAVLAVAVAQLWADRRRLRAELNAANAAEAPSGSAPRHARARFRARRSRGAAGSLTELSERARPTVLVFVSTGCGPCLTMLPSLAHWQDALSDSVTVAAIFEGAAGGGRARQRGVRAEPRAGAEGQEAFELYALRATPSAVLIDRDGAIAERRPRA